MPVTLEHLLEERAIEAVLNAYAQACDTRDWDLLGTVFSEDASVNYGDEFKLTGSAPIIDMVKSMLGGCGPTQHLLGNFQISVSETSATCSCYVRAAHAGMGNTRGQYYEVWAQYRDALQKRDGQWKIVQRKMVVHQEVGSRSVLGPETP